MSTNKHIQPLFEVLCGLIEAEHYIARDDIRARFAARLFTDSSDDGMARFFVHAADTMGTWGASAAQSQLCKVGEHLNECECSSPKARELIEDLHAFTTGDFVSIPKASVRP